MGEDFPSSLQQRETLQWLTESYPLRLTGNDNHEVILHRFVLELFFKTTSRWLSQRIVCAWEGIICGPGRDSRLVTSMINNVDFAPNLVLRGTFPSELGLLTTLTKLEPSFSPLLGGCIPTEIGMLTALTYLQLISNRLTGTNTSEIGNLRELSFLLLEDNLISGPIPSEIGELSTQLLYAFFQGNHLSGPVPSELGRLTVLQMLQLQCNLGLDPNVPAELGNVSVQIGNSSCC